MNNEKLHQDQCNLIHSIYCMKNADYGNSFEDSLDEFGLLPAVILINNKINRLKQLTKQEAKVNESIVDTFTDIANYAIITLCWLQKEGK